jgi:hypothetical protein
VLWTGTFVIGGGTVIAAMANGGLCTSMSDHQNYVRLLVVSPLISNLHFKIDHVMTSDSTITYDDIASFINNHSYL